MEWQGVLGWLMAIGGACLWLWEAYKIIARQRAENEKMKEFLREAIEAMRSLYSSHENALKFYREIVSTLLHDRSATMKKGDKYIVKSASKQYTASDPVLAVKKARENGDNGQLVLKGFFTAPRRMGKINREE